MSSKSICGGQQWSVSVSDVFFLPSDFFTDWAIYKICKVFNVEYFDAACWYLFKHTFVPDTYAFLWTDNLFFSISPFLPVIWFLSLCSVKFLYFVCHFCCFFFFFGRLKLGTYGLVYNNAAPFVTISILSLCVSFAQNQTLRMLRIFLVQ